MTKSAMDIANCSNLSSKNNIMPNDMVMVVKVMQYTCQNM